MYTSRNRGLEEAYKQIYKEDFGTPNLNTTTTPAATGTSPMPIDDDEHINGVLELIKSGKIDGTKLSDAIKKHLETSSTPTKEVAAPGNDLETKSPIPGSL